MRTNWIMANGWLINEWSRRLAFLELLPELKIQLKLGLRWGHRSDSWGLWSQEVSRTLMRPGRDSVFIYYWPPLSGLRENMGPSLWTPVLRHTWHWHVRKVSRRIFSPISKYVYLAPMGAQAVTISVCMFYKVVLQAVWYSSFHSDLPSWLSVFKQS